MAHSNQVLVACIVVVALAGLGGSPAMAQICKGLDIGELLTECGPFVQKDLPEIPPSDGCCTVLKGVDVPCACNHLPGDAGELVSVEKAVYVARFCGIELETGSKCGSYTIPPPLPRA